MIKNSQYKKPKVYHSLGKARQIKSDALKPFYKDKKRQTFLATVTNPRNFEMFKGSPAYTIQLNQLSLLNTDGSSTLILNDIHLPLVNTFINLGNLIPGDEIIFNASIVEKQVLLQNYGALHKVLAYDLLRPTKAHFRDDSITRTAISEYERVVIQTCKICYHS
ncbi:hypothetical protein DY052_06370 [Apilactobacillus timberlakei]|uniref:hypothetical protein n=1 Tax=Apilactobacillus timberlakei TaxID=2008380 RepID=UPI0011272D69|nr:hypothetical protein [Apilactobacillus timberlakei]TPR15049.1 hypothetical protein DY052_06370 [Apilactobacillus timberlakei]